MPNDEIEMLKVLNSIKEEIEYRKEKAERIQELEHEIAQLRNDRSESFAREHDYRSKMAKLAEQYVKGIW